LKVIAVLHYNNHDGVIHACVPIIVCISSKYSKCVSAIKRILYSTAMYIFSSSSMNLCISLYRDACLKSSALRVGVKTLLYTFGARISRHFVFSPDNGSCINYRNVS